MPSGIDRTTFDASKSRICETPDELREALQAGKPSHDFLRKIVTRYNREHTSAAGLDLLLLVIDEQSTLPEDALILRNLADLIVYIRDTVRLRVPAGESRKILIPLSIASSDVPVLAHEKSTDTVSPQLLLEDCQSLLNRGMDRLSRAMQGLMNEPADPLQALVIHMKTPLPVWVELVRQDRLLQALSHAEGKEFVQYIGTLPVRQQCSLIRKFFQTFKNTHHPLVQMARYWKDTMPDVVGEHCTDVPLLFFENRELLVLAATHCKYMHADHVRAPARQGKISDVRKAMQDDATTHDWLRFSMPLLFNCVSVGIDSTTRRSCLQNLLTNLIGIGPDMHRKYLSVNCHISASALNALMVGQNHTEQWKKILFHCKQVWWKKRRTERNGDMHEENQDA